MEKRYSSTLSLPQAHIRPAKRSLVKTARSDGETNQLDIQYFSDHLCQPKKLRLNKFTYSFDELSFDEECILSPSAGDNATRSFRVPSQDDLWTSIKSNYIFLMADDLIEECKETRKELHLLELPIISSPSAQSYQKIITISEFKDRFNQFHDKLHSIQIYPAQKLIDEGQIQELSSEFRFLKEQAKALKFQNPDLVEDLTRRINILSNKWDLLERVMYPERAKARDGIIKNLSIQMRDIRKWLREVEEKLRKLQISHDCRVDEMNEIYNQEKILQQEIEGRGEELTSLVRQCSSLEGATVAETKRLRRAATHLERSWHNIWIRSLEKQCLTEQRLLQHQSNDTKSQESSDIDSDEGPLSKHRRLTLDHWTAVTSTATMNKPRYDVLKTRNSSDVLQKSPTRDIGVLCSNLVPVNDKCIMVGTTGIAALKAEYGDDFTNFEIIQDVGYSSESSTHLSSDDGIGIGGNRYFNIRVYKYLDDKSQKTSLSLKEEIENACAKQFHSLSSSVDSSSGGTSLNDSGLGTTDAPVGEDASESFKEQRSVDEKQLNDCGEFSSEEAYLHDEELEFLESILASCSDLSNDDVEKRYQNILDKSEELPFTFSGIDSDDTTDNFQSRVSFTKPAQAFYKMISVESDNCEEESRGIDVGEISTEMLYKTKIGMNSEEHILGSSESLNKISESNSERDILHSNYKKSTYELKKQAQRQQKLRTSTPLRKPNHFANSNDNSHHLNLKRKRGSDSTSSASMREYTGLSPNHVRSWLKRCSVYSETSQRTRSKRALFHVGSPNNDHFDFSSKSSCFNTYDDLSSCDASGEYTSSSADEENILLSSNSHLEDSFCSKERFDSCSMEGSIETVIKNLSTSLREDSDTFVMSPCASFSPLTSSTCLQNDLSKNKTTKNLSSSDNQFSTFSSEEQQMRLGKSVSDNDLKAHSELDLMKNSDGNHMKKEFLRKCHPGSKRLSSSLPSILYNRSGSSTEDASGSTLFNNVRKCEYSLQQDRRSCHAFSHNFSSSSELGKRKRRRKKSSSSARSSRSALNSSDPGRQRSRTLTNSLVTCNSRGRHFSQASTFFQDSESNIFSEDDGSSSEIKTSRKEDLVRKNLSEDFARTLDDSSNEGINSEILSPVESDVVLTHLEEQSTVSDQVWDGYQEMPYLSEGYSEATVDEDAIRKLTEFGDDYVSAIGQPLRFLDASDSKMNKNETSKSPKKPSKSLMISHVQKTCSFSNDSDSDSDDLQHVIEEARKALHFARTTLKKGQSGDFITSAEYAELLATCGTHLRCLQTICEHIESDENEINFSFSDLEELRNLIKEWEILKNSAEMYSESDDHVKRKYIKAKRNIDELLNRMSELASVSDVEMKSINSWDDLNEKISHLQMVMTTLQSAKEQLLAVNLEVHRFMTDHGCDLDYKDCSLKNDVTELYQRWEDIYENNEKQLTSLEIICNKWKIYKEKLRALLYNVKVIENVSSEVACDDISFTNSANEESSSLKSTLIDLQRDAAILKEFLKGGATWESIDLELQDLAERINKYSRTQQSSRKVDHQVSIEEDDPDDQFEDAIQHLDSDGSGSSHYCKLLDGTGAKEDSEWVPKKKPSRFWRIIRIAVPVQLALVFLYCLACCLEPNCCDMLNNFNFSLSPHLRYWRGPPPA